MNKIKHIERLTQRELDSLTPLNASWHHEYRDSAYIFIGGLNYRMNEGDLVIAFSQFGEVVDCRLARDRKTGRSRGFAFLAYEDQRSTVLAVDNMNGAEVCGRQIMVDHVRQYKIPREYLETEEDKKKRKEKEKAKKLAERKKDPANYAEEEEKLSQDLSESKHSDSDDSDNPEYEGMSPEEIEELKWKKRLYKPTGPDGKGWGDFRTLNAQDLEVL
jgi:RNA-binding motif protein, X-linked 2